MLCEQNRGVAGVGRGILIFFPMTILVSVKKLRRALQMRVEKTKLVVEPDTGRNSRLARLVYY